MDRTFDDALEDFEKKARKLDYTKILIAKAFYNNGRSHQLEECSEDISILTKKILDTKKLQHEVKDE